MLIDGPGIYLMHNGEDALITAWVPLDAHPDGGHWIGIVNPSLTTLRSPFNSWMANGKDCEGYGAWAIVSKRVEE